MNEQVGKCKDCANRDYYGDCSVIKKYIRTNCDCEGPSDGYGVDDDFGCVLFEQKKKVIMVDYRDFHSPYIKI